MNRLKLLLLRLVQFVTVDIWRITGAEVTRRSDMLYRIIKTVYLSIRDFLAKDLQKKATALTFSTLLAFVPALAIFFAIARGFGFQKVLEEFLLEYSTSETEVMNVVLGFVNAYMEQARGGVFMGIGVVVLLVSVINVLRSVESVFNDIWQVKKSRAIVRQVIDYISVIVVTPIVLILVSGFSVYMSSAFSSTALGEAFSPVINVWMKFLTYVVICALFTLIYIAVPNVKVRFVPALIAGVIAGTAFELLQMLYINGQIGVSKYNAVYGSLAALPLLMLWMQFSFSILLFGAELSFAYQNVQNYDFESDIKNITPHYKNFLYLLILNRISKRFEMEEKPIPVAELAEENRVPIQLASSLAMRLEEAGFLVKTTSDDGTFAYVPAFDIHKMTVALVYDRMERFGSENFKVDIDGKFKNIWDVNDRLYEQRKNLSTDIYIKDL